jgi:hypothetical protein
MGADFDREKILKAENRSGERGEELLTAKFARKAAKYAKNSLGVNRAGWASQVFLTFTIFWLQVRLQE